MNYWINSNSGDYITEDNGQYKLHMLPRWAGDSGDYENFLNPETIDLTPIQLESIKGFIPIKEKKLWARKSAWYRGEHEYKSSGKGLAPTRVLTKAELREEIINNLLNGK